MPDGHDAVGLSKSPFFYWTVVGLWIGDIHRTTAGGTVSEGSSSVPGPSGLYKGETTVPKDRAGI